MHKATPVTFTSSSVPGRTFSGTIYDVNATPTTGTLSYRARVIMPNPDDVLRGGMLVSVSVRKQFHPRAIVVPLTSVVQGSSGAAVYTVVPLPEKPGAAGPPGAPTFATATLVPVTLGWRRTPRRK